MNKIQNHHKQQHHKPRVLRIQRSSNVAWTFMLALLLVCGALWPVWPYSNDWGYAPALGTGVLALLLVLLMTMGVFKGKSNDMKSRPPL